MASMTQSIRVPAVGGRVQIRASVRRSQPAAMRVSAFSSDRVASINNRSFQQGSSIQATRTVTVSRRASRQIAVTVAKKLSIGDMSKEDIQGQRVLVRADLNVPLKDGVIMDDTRIRAAIPTLKYLIDNGARVLLTSHLGRPKDGPEDKFRLTPVVPRLSELLGSPVKSVDDCIGPKVESAVAELKNGEVLVLENVRFYKEEEKNDVEFSRKLASNADMFVNDAFGTAHRAHSSTTGVTAFLKPSVAGFLLQKELDYLDGAIKAPQRPFVAIVGGSKVSSKIGVIEALLEKADKVIIVGGMVFTFDKSKGLACGGSLVEDDKLDLAQELMAKFGDRIVLPTDVLIADKFAEDAATKVVKSGEIPDGWMGLDIGPDSIKLIQDTLASAKTVVWNGPAGVFEFPAFAKGTNAIAQSLADITTTGAITIVGGGDSVAAIEQAGLADQVSHISTGGGASLELLEGKILPGVAALDEPQVHA